MKKKNILRLVPGSQDITLKALTGVRKIGRVKNTFSEPLGDKFFYWGLNKPGLPTPVTKIQIHDMVADGTLMDIFRSLPGTWEQKCLSQDQVIEFCKTSIQWLHQGSYYGFFLIKKNENVPIDESRPEDNLVVVEVRVGSRGRFVDVNCLEDDHLFYGAHGHRIVSPQLPVGN